MTDLTTERLRLFLRYSKTTGVFTWIATRRGQRPKVGDTAGSIGENGYVAVCFDGVTYLAHRLAWFYVHGDWPTHEVDHRNRKRADNRWRNLRCATDAEQRQNQSIGSNNKTGYLGVRQHRCGKFEANIKTGGRPRYLGLFKTAKQASTAYRAAKRLDHTFNPETRHG